MSQLPDTKNILLWRAERVGDAVMTVPAVRLIRSAAPYVHITYATTDYAAETARILHLGDRILEFKFKAALRNLPRYAALRREVRRDRFDRIVVFAKPTQFIRHIAPLDRCIRPEPREGEHFVEYCLRAVRQALGIEDCFISSPRMEIEDQPETLERFARLGLDIGHSAYVVMHPGCNRLMRGKRRSRTPMKSWPPEYYAALIGCMASRFPDVKVVLVGARPERSLVESMIMKALPAGASVLNLCGMTNILDLLILLKHALLLVSGDSGVMHLGTVAGTPMIVLLGPTDERQTGPFGMGEDAILIRAVPRERAGSDPDCMRKISVEQVLEKMKVLLNKGERRFSSSHTSPVATFRSSWTSGRLGSRGR